ncbi:RBP11-like subunits of RNA polymerase, partial [Cucurbitaria berberidis CBS 394.84]
PAEDYPDPDEHMLPAPREQKIEEQEVANVPNCAIFIINKEDDTIGNLLTQRLLKCDFVDFAAYQVDPLFARFRLRVTTDGSVSPREAVNRCCLDIHNDLGVLSSAFKSAHESKMAEKKQASEQEVENGKAAQKGLEELNKEEGSEGPFGSGMADG